jgi:hypothetical protein
VTLTCGVSPVVNPPATCSLGPTQVTNGTGTAPLTVTTTGPQAALAPAGKRGPRRLFAIALMIPAMLLSGAGFRKSGRTNLLSLFLILLLGGCLLQVACGVVVRSRSLETPAGIYTVMITGNANGTQRTTSVLLTVQ